MSYRNQYSGSPWQQGGPPFGVGGYNQNYGGYDQYGSMNSGYNRNQGGYGGGGGGMYGGSGMGQMRNMGYGRPSPSQHYMNDRMGGRSMPRGGQLQRKRLPQRSPASGPRSKRPNIESDRRSSGLKMRRHRDSRGGSRGHHDDSDDDEDNTYNPEEPTEDYSDIECDSFECWKPSDEDEEVEVEQNGDKEEKEGEAEKGDETTKKLFLCYICKVKCSSKEVLVKHQNNINHTTKVEELLSIRREKKKDGSGDDKKDKESSDDRKKMNRKPGNWCTVCECAFVGNFLAHRRTKEHRKKRDKKYPKCRPCRMGFSSSEEYRDHYKSEDHKQRSAEFHYLKNLASGSDEDEAAIEPVKLTPEELAEEEKMEEEVEEKAEDGDGDDTAEDQDKTDDEKDEKDDTEKEKKEDKEKGKEEKEKKKEVKKKPREPRNVGQSFVVSVQGYYCKLCHKFFKDVTVAKSKHCRSIMHTDAFKKAMAEAIEQEEERQKQAEEQDKLDKIAQEAAERAAEIASIERAARDAIKKELAAKKSGKKDSEDIEMKDVSEDAEKEDVVDEITEEANGGADDKPEPDAEEIKEVIDEDEPKKDDEKKEDPEPEEEQEEVEEKVTSSPATRRGRGRGRGRKRR